MRTYRTGGFLLHILFFLTLLDTLFRRLFARLYLVVDLFLLLMFGVVDAHARELVLDRHDRVAQQHALLVRRHDLAEFDVLALREARVFAAVADRLCDAVGAAVDLRKDGREQRRAARAELAAVLLMMFAAVYTESLADVLLFLRDVVLDLGRFALREET